MKLVKFGTNVNTYLNDTLVSEITNVMDNTFSIRLINGSYGSKSAQIMSARLDNFKLICGNEIIAEDPVVTTPIDTTNSEINTIQFNVSTLLLGIVILLVIILIICIGILLKGNKKIK